MAIISKPSIIRKGDNNQIELDQEQLLLHPVIAANNYYNNTNRWRFIMLTYVSEPNGNVAKVVFDPDDSFQTTTSSPTVFGDFSPSEFAENDFRIQMLSIYGFDNSPINIYRSDLDEVEFDILLTDSYGFYSYRLLPLHGALQLGGSTIQMHLSLSMWYKFDTTQTLGAQNYLLSIGYDQNYGEAELYGDASGDLYISVEGAPAFPAPVLVNAVNVFDGNWHSIILSYSGLTGTGGYEEVTVFVDGVKEQVITGLTNPTVDNIFIGNPTANELAPTALGCRGFVAQAELWSEYFDTSQAVQYHNNGSVLNPNLHIFANQLVNDWTFGDNIADDGQIVYDNQGAFDLTIYEEQGVPAQFRSGLVEPTWSLDPQILTEDNDIFWETIDDDSSNPPVWVADTVYGIGTVVAPTVAFAPVKLFRMTSIARIVQDQP
jgi:hypothetical protein